MSLSFLTRATLALLISGSLATTAHSVENPEETEPITALPAAPENQPETAEEPAPVAEESPAPSEPQKVPPSIPTLPADVPFSTSPVPVPTPQAETAEKPDQPSVTSTESLKVIAARKKLKLPLPRASIVIDKSERRLDLLSGGVLVKSYRVSLGSSPSGAKKSQGDGRTPEGRFYICTRNTKTSAFHIFLGLSYPGLSDAKRGVSNKQISQREYQIINSRLASRGRPPWETNLGGWVGIHGGTEGSFAQKKMRQRGSRDWTAGCIGLNNSEITELYAATQMGTPVHIVP